MNNTPRGLLSYPEAAVTYGVSTRTLSRLVVAGRLTRYRSNRDQRRVLLDAEELHNYFSQPTTADNEEN